MAALPRFTFMTGLGPGWDALVVPAEDCRAKVSQKTKPVLHPAAQEERKAGLINGEGLVSCLVFLGLEINGRSLPLDWVGSLPVFKQGLYLLFCQGIMIPWCCHQLRLCWCGINETEVYSCVLAIASHLLAVVVNPVPCKTRQRCARKVFNLYIYIYIQVYTHIHMYHMSDMFIHDFTHVWCFYTCCNIVLLQRNSVMGGYARHHSDAAAITWKSTTRIFHLRICLHHLHLTIVFSQASIGSQYGRAGTSKKKPTKWIVRSHGAAGRSSILAFISFIVATIFQARLTHEHLKLARANTLNSHLQCLYIIFWYFSR